MDEFQRVRKTYPSHIAYSSGEKLQKWIPPPENVFKVNVDAAINAKDHTTGVGVVIRGTNGKVIAAGINQSSLKGTVNNAEAEAMLWGIQVAREANLASLIIESDCLEVVQLVNNTKDSITNFFWTILEIQNQLKDFNKVAVHHTPR